MDKYVKTLKDNKLKITPQRLEILRYLDTHRTHPTAEGIYSDLKKLNPSMSKTTIYNTLQLLDEHGLILTLTISGSELKFDGDISPHHHFLCKSCGKIYDVDIVCPNADKVEAGGHRVDEIHGYFKGICKKCLNNGKREENGMDKYRCTVCGYIYDPAEGDSDGGIKPSIAFGGLPEDWRCPVCGAKTKYFEKE